MSANFSCVAFGFPLAFYISQALSQGHFAPDITSVAELSLFASAACLEEAHSKLMVRELLAAFLPHFIFDIQQKYCRGKATPKQWKNVCLYTPQFYISPLFNWWFKQWQEQLLMQLTSINGNFPQAVIWHFRSTAFVTVESTVWSVKKGYSQIISFSGTQLYFFLLFSL